MNFKTYLKEINEQETFDIGKGLSGEELKTAMSAAVKKCTQDHRGAHYNEKTGKVTYT